MNRWLTFLLCSCVTAATSQALVLDSTHFFQANQYYPSEYVFDYEGVQSYGLLDQEGAHQIWDFSTLDVSGFEFSTTLQRYTSSGEGENWRDSLPEAEMQIRTEKWSDIFEEGQFKYLKKEGEIVQQVGYSRTASAYDDGILEYYDNPRNYFYEGLTFGDIRIDTFSVSASRMGVDTLVADGYGSIVLPDGDTIQNVLRVKRKTYTYHIDYPESGQHSFSIDWYADAYETPLYTFESSEIGFNWPFFQRFAFKPDIYYPIKYSVKSVEEELVENFYHQIYSPRDATVQYDIPPNPSDENCYYLYYRSLSKNRQMQLYKYANANNGISTFDLIKIRKHILGIETFEHPWQYIAADVNNSGTITGMDLLLIRRLLLQQITEFPDVDSWKFMPIDYEFPNPDNPLAEPLPPAFSIPDATFEGETFQFLGIKMGDLNGSAEPRQ